MTVAAKRRLLGLSLALLGIAPFLGADRDASAQPVSLEAARKEGKVVIYGTIVPQIMSVIQKGFEGKYGIKIEYWRADATKVIDRALTEWRAGRPGFDLVTGTRGALLLLKQEDVIAKSVPASSENFPAKFRDKDGRLTARDHVSPIRRSAEGADRVCSVGQVFGRSDRYGLERQGGESERRKDFYGISLFT